MRAGFIHKIVYVFYVRVAGRYVAEAEVKVNHNAVNFGRGAVDKVYGGGVVNVSHKVKVPEKKGPV